MNFKSIKTRLIFWFLLLTLLPLLVVLVITYFQRVSVIESRTIDKLSSIKELKVQQVSNWLDDIESDIRILSTTSEIIDIKYAINEHNLQSSDNVYVNRTKELLANYIRYYYSFNEIFIIDAHTGKVIVSTNTASIGKDKSEDECFIKPMETGDIAMKDIYYSKTISDFSMTYSIPIYHSSTDKSIIIGVLVARIDLNNSLYRILLNRIGLGETGETLIVNEDGVTLNQLRWYDNAPLSLKIEAEPAIRAASGETGVARTNDYRNKEVLAVFTYIPQAKWGFVVKQDMDELNEPIDQMIYSFILIFIVASLTIGIVAITIANSIAKVVVNMDAVARSLRSGNFKVRNKIFANDELGSLAQEFNNLADITESRIMVQQGISSITNVMIGRSSMSDFSMSLLKELQLISEANICVFYILNEKDGVFEHLSSIGADKQLLTNYDGENPEGDFGNAVSGKSIYYLKNIPEDSIFKYKTITGDIIPKELITIPLIIDNVVVALISLSSISKFTTDFQDIINQTWEIINTAYSNFISSERTRVFADHLSRINEQLEKQSKELQHQAEEMQVQSEELQRTSTELQTQNIELEDQRKQIMIANNLKSEFLSNMSHELRTPLNSILALSGVLISDSNQKLSEEENNYLSIIERNGKRLLTLINDILDLSKIEAGKMDINASEIALGQLIRVVVENVHTLAESKGLSINMDIPKNLPLIETDESRLHQVLLNIVGNSVKFTEEGGIDIKVTAHDDNILIIIKDTGIGIPEEVLPHIFDEFRQADGTYSRNYEGTGLGLAIAKKILEILGGSISVESQLGIGSTFSVTVPIKWHDANTLIKENQKTSNNVNINNNSVLVVDDDPKVVIEISEFLTRSGYNTITTMKGTEALSLAKKYIPIAITLDIIMPDMDGWEVLQQLKADPTTSKIPVIIVSVSNEMETGIALGATGYVNKPIQKEQLIKQIELINSATETVLIVDDNEVDLRQMAKIVQSANIRTLLATGGKECLEAIEKEIPDILVLDLLMPKFDGFKVIQHLKKDPKTINIPVIIVTAKDLTKEDKKVLEGNITSLVKKTDTTKIELYEEIVKILNDFRNNTIDSIETIMVKKNAVKPDTKANILIVEDNPDNMVTIKAILGDNYTIWEATGGEEALLFVKVQPVDLILLDMSLPKMSGKEVVHILKSDKNTMSIPVIAVTAQVMVGDRESFIEAGCDDYVPKPIDNDELTTKVVKYIGY